MTNPQLFLPKPRSIQPHPHWHMGALGTTETFDLGRATATGPAKYPHPPPLHSTPLHGGVVVVVVWGERDRERERERERERGLISAGQVESVKLIIEVN